MHLYQRLAQVSALATLAAASTASFSIPPTHTGSNAVGSNFFGISIELSIINTLIGNTTSTIPNQIEQYLANIQTRSKNPVRVRIGGNSMDDSTYNPNQTEMIVFPNPASNINDQPVTYGPVLYDVLADLASKIGGAQYLIGLSLRLFATNNEPLIVNTAKEKLGSSLDAFLLGNEPDLYGPHLERPANYTEADYFAEFANVSTQLNSSSYGNLLSTPLIGGPTVCCNWDLGQMIDAGYLTDFQNELKYLNLQHYPQNNCGGKPEFTLSYYLQHFQVITLAKWQSAGVQDAHKANMPILLGEFNSASCGGIAGISDTFGATMWALDYVLQLASVGYSGAYMHTREAGITYNLFDPPAAGSSSSNWTTLPTYYALLPAAEALNAKNGTFVLDLNINNNTQNSTSAGYGLYDGKTSALYGMVFFNFADAGNGTTSFPVTTGNTPQTVLVRYLSAPSVEEKSNISWGGKTLNGVGDAIMVDSGSAPDQQFQCNSSCTVEVPSPGVAVVWLDATEQNSSPNSTSSTTSHETSDGIPYSSHSTFAYLMAIAIGLVSFIDLI